MRLEGGGRNGRPDVSLPEPPAQTVGGVGLIRQQALWLAKRQKRNVVYKSAVESAGMSDLEEGQKVIFETHENERKGDLSAISLKVFAPETVVRRSFVGPNPFEVISSFISSARSLLLPG